MDRILFHLIERISLPSWRRTFEGPRTIVGMLNKATLVVLDGLSKDIAAFLLAKRVLRIRKRFLFLALYLKQCASSLQKAYAGDKNVGRMPVFVALNGSGFPLRIPGFHRRIIMEHSSRSDTLVKLYLSWFSLYKLILLTKKVNKDTFSSITSGVKDGVAVTRVCSEVKSKVKIFCDSPGSRRFPLEKG